MIFVLCGNAKEYDFFCRENDLHPRKDARYITDGQMLLGLRDIKVVRTGTYYQRHFEWSLDVRQTLEMRGYTDVSKDYHTT